MIKKYLIAGGSILLLVAILFVGSQSLNKRITSIPLVNMTNRTHTDLYQQATQTWNANLQTASLNSSSRIRITWEQPEQTYNHFLMTVTDPVTNWTRTESGEHNRVSLDFTDLFSDTEYVFVVRACSDPDCSSWFISEQEPRARTENTKWKIVKEQQELSQLPILENWEQTVSLEKLILLSSNEQPLPDEEKATFKIEKVYLQNNGSLKMKLSRSEDKGVTIFFADLLNP